MQDRREGGTMNNSLSIPERMAIERVVMPQVAAADRCRNFEEVNRGLSDDQALSEAHRCLQCQNRACVGGCPVGVAIPEFINALACADLPRSAEILRHDNALAAICGRVCPQERQCEALCARGIKGEAVAIGYLERYVADWALRNLDKLPHDPLPVPSGRSVAVAGSGPAGLTVAGELARCGHAVTIFEALHATGGVLRYGIPEFRLPKEIIEREVALLCELGVTVECNVIVGKTLTVAELRSQFDAVFIANGAGLPTMLGIAGENLKGVYTANEFLTRVNLMGAGRCKESATPIIMRREVAVIGGGNTAIDSIRTARRLGAERAMIIYRRGEAEMPARREEIRHAREEGVEFVVLTAPSAILGSSDGWVSGLRCRKMVLGAPDSSGRRTPLAIEGSDFELPIGVVINAIGTRANPLLTKSAADLALDERGNILINADGETSLPGVFAGGDIVRGGATVILAMGDGKRAAAAIDLFLKQ
jgi:glutamate synthase (NADPH/NADH) small chain